MITEVPWTKDDMVEISLKEPDDFLKVRETLTRIGVASRKEKKLYQSCHILHKKGQYYIVHFKELFALDGKRANLSENDVQRRNRIIKLLSDWGLVEIVKEEEQWTYQMFDRCVNEEKVWAEYLFKNGSMIGLNDKLLHQYVEWIANKRMKAIGLKPVYDIPARNNPLPWTQHWISSKGLQVAPQETEVESYIVGGIKQDVKKDTFAGFKL